MSNTLSQEKIAILAGNGFNENAMTAMQRALQAAGAKARMIGVGGTLLQGWSESGWGHHFAADQLVNEALAVDYDILIIPGGPRNIEKLMTTAHTRRFLRGFMEAGKKVVLFDEAIELLSFIEMSAGRSFASGDDSFVVDGGLITVLGADVDEAVTSVMEEISGFTTLKKVA